MKRIATLVPSVLLAQAAFAQAAQFERPIPQPQTEAAEFWFLIASISLLISLYAVHRLVTRR